MLAPVEDDRDGTAPARNRRVARRPVLRPPRDPVRDAGPRRDRVDRGVAAADRERRRRRLAHHPAGVGPEYSPGRRSSSNGYVRTSERSRRPSTRPRSSSATTSDSSLPSVTMLSPSGSMTRLAPWNANGPTVPHWLTQTR